MNTPKPILKVENVILTSNEDEERKYILDRLSFNVYDNCVTVIYSKPEFNFTKIYDVLTDNLSESDYLEKGKVDFLEWNEELTTSQKFKDVRKRIFFIDKQKLEFLEIDQTIGNLLVNTFKKNSVPLISRLNQFIESDYDLYSSGIEERNKKLDRAKEDSIEKEREINSVANHVISMARKRMKSCHKRDVSWLKLKEIINEAEEKRMKGIQSIEEEYSETVRTIVGDWNKRKDQLCTNYKKTLRKAKIDNKNYIDSIRYNAKIKINQLKREKRSLQLNPRRTREINEEISEIKHNTKMRTKINKKDINIQIMALLKKLEVENPYEFLNKTKEGLTDVEIFKLHMAYAILEQYSIIFIDRSMFKDSKDLENLYSDFYQKILDFKNTYNISFVVYTTNLEEFVKFNDCYRVIAYGSRTMEMGFKDFSINAPYNEYARNVFLNKDFSYSPKELDQMNLYRIRGEHYVNCTSKKLKEIENSLPKIPLSPKVKFHKKI